ncbi:GAF domain-containing protein [Saccharothrix sp. ST-888]|uniref:GAF domain-containing protein n=1 Tax=Saccharothrix sp. ST-888 TaxID=1427391 RepID=UPI000696AC6A|nr:GAF domain-containing protein [Saccharothrix sp. ST-888]
MNSTLWNADSQISERYLLQCVVEVAKAAFRAKACSVFVVDDETDELVFEAVAGEGESHLVGTRFSAGTGIAGWVVASGQPFIADDLEESRFDQEAAQETGYVPRTIAAAPILHEGLCIGVLEVLDRDAARDELETLELVGLLSTQAAAGIALLRQIRQGTHHAAGNTGAAADNTDVLRSIATDLPRLDADDERLVAQVLAVAGEITRRAAFRRPVPGSNPTPPASAEGDRSSSTEGRDQ